MKTMTKWASVALSAALTLGSIGSTTQTASAASPKFSDVTSTHWAAGAIHNAVAKGYVDGYTNGTFKPEASVTRAEFVKMVVVAMKLDVKDAAGRWYSPYVDVAVNQGLYAAADFANSEAAWNKTMTRDDMARVAARAVGDKTTENDKWMYLATKSGLIQGVAAGQVAPKGLTTRAQAVVIIERILSKNTGVTLPVDRYAVGAAEILWHGTNIFTVMPEMFVTPESDWKNKGKSSVEEMWNEKAMTITSKDGLYQAKLDALVAIDMADPNDPNRSLLGDINTLKWYNGNPWMKIPVKGNTNTYVMYFKSKQVFNKDESKYLNRPFAQFSVRGFTSNDGAAQAAGKLNRASDIYRNAVGDVPAIIVPKSGTVQGMFDMTITLQTPTSGSRFSETDLLVLRGLQ
ncbi:S-layer homology domain-containing protein [Saccharibacillus deserti]|uniref:S-layer homology domain-containing protein n=1 Tax=Saccharibacillus deserti TaxID=1634444 RepID=UPI0015530ECB|nr:S-layer homology domain-containing protein [Saccharibacillus deserti]